MHAILDLYQNQAFWMWVGVAALLLAIESLTGSGYLLWPAGSAGIVAVVALGAHLGLPKDLVIFAVLTVVSTYVGRRYLRPAPTPPQGELNDRGARLVGQIGKAVGEFKDGHGRVFVDGAEWIAETEPDASIATGSRVEVSAVIGGGRLKVRPV
jgi:membrane protein implicated in regulation of membrane protease activity